MQQAAATHQLQKLCPSRNERTRVRFGSKADMCSATRHVRFVPIADILPRGRNDQTWVGTIKVAA